MAKKLQQLKDELDRLSSLLHPLVDTLASQGVKYSTVYSGTKGSESVKAGI